MHITVPSTALFGGRAEAVCLCAGITQKQSLQNEKSAEANAELLVAALVLLTGSPSCVQQDLLKQLQSL